MDCFIVWKCTVFIQNLFFLNKFFLNIDRPTLPILDPKGQYKLFLLPNYVTFNIPVIMLVYITNHLWCIAPN